MATPVQPHPETPLSLLDILERGKKWFVDPKNDQYALLYSTEAKGLRSTIYTREQLLNIDAKLPDTLNVLALCGAVSQEIHNGLKYSYDFWAKEPPQVYSKNGAALNRYFKDWLSIYTVEDTLKVEAKCYQPVHHPDVKWPVIKPWLIKATVDVDPIQMDEHYPGFLGALEVCALTGLPPDQAAKYCLGQLNLESNNVQEELTSPYDIS